MHFQSVPYTAHVNFRDRLLATIRAARPVLEEPGIMVVGSEVPNLLEAGAAATLVVSQDLDIAVPVDRHDAIKRRLPEIAGLHPSTDEPSIWVPDSADLIEVNFIGIDATRDPADAFLLEDVTLPLMVFGALSLVTPGAELVIADTRVRLPRPAGLLLEKLVTDRTGEKGDRDLLVAAGMLAVATAADIDEAVAIYNTLRPQLQHIVRSNLTVLSLLDPRPAMPDPRPLRTAMAALLNRLEEAGQ